MILHDLPHTTGIRSRLAQTSHPSKIFEKVDYDLSA